LAASEAWPLAGGAGLRARLAKVRGHVLLASYLLALVPALVLAVAQPVWSRVDEPQHFDLIDQYAHGVNPIEAVTTVRPETLSLMRSTGVYSGDLPGVWPSPYVDPNGFSPPPAGLEGYPRLLWMARHRWQFSYETQQAPLFYLAAVPVFAVADAAGGPLGAVVSLRILEALLAATVAPLAYLLALEVAPERRWAAAAAVLAALVPGFVLNGTQITNDTPAVALSGLVLLLGLRWGRRTPSPARAALLGLLLGAALLTKLSAIAIAPAVAAALLIPGLAARETLRARVVATACTALVAAACLLPWFAVNYRVYGALTAAAPATSLGAVPHVPATAGYLAQSALHAFVTYWTGEPLLTLAGWQLFCLVAVVMSAFAAAGLVRLWRRPRADRSTLAVLVIAAAGAGAFTVALPALANDPYLAPGRYAYVALPAIAALIAAGLGAELRGRAATAAAGAVAIAGLALLGAFVAGIPAPQQPGDRRPPTSAQLSRTPLDGRLEDGFAGVDLVVEGLAADPAGGALWVRVKVTDEGGKAAEWTPVPIVSRDHRVLGMADYLQSTPLPQHLAPGESEAGWIKIPMPASELARSTPMTLSFLDIAVDDYARVGTVSFRFSL
jgi:hypothetical protein